MRHGIRAKLGTTGIYIVCIFLAILSIFPFYIMIVNATRSTYEIQSTAISLIPSTHIFDNYAVFDGKKFDPIKGFLHSMLVSSGATILAVYFSTLTAYSVVVYDWKLKNAFFTFVMCVLMIPAQLTTIGFYKMMYSWGWVNSFAPLIIPSIAAPSMVFFMRQYMIPALSLEIVQSARIDGAGEFYIFNRIAMPIMKPAIATQAIFTFVNSWNQLFMPLILLRQEKYTMPCMVSLLNNDFYKTEYGAVYLGLFLTVLPLFVVYFALSKYIIAGVALGSVKG